MQDLLMAAFLGIVEGVTEFLPVSSTGHLILVEDLLGFEGPPGHVFDIVIQLGAILAVVWVYRMRFLRVAAGLASEPRARRFVLLILVGFLPAAVLGALLHGFIKSVLFSPWVVAVSLVLGGIAILLIEGFLGREDRGRVAEVENLSYGTALAIGFCQALAMIPGVSRAGATIMGALLLGVSRPTAVEFSFFLAIPTMLGATVFDLYKNRGTLDLSGGLLIAVGFVLAFLSALLVVRGFVAFITRHGFAPFGWYRIVVGLAMLAILLLR